MTLTSWIIVIICLGLWTFATYIVGEFSERKWGDRESGALVGFFAPGLIFMLCLYLC
ncbi:hypothetical protein [Endozoicomonas lisbonensis]